MAGGYAGPGAKAVIPARATAKLTLRLVPDQDPVEIDALLRGFIARIAPPAVYVVVRTLFSARPFVMRRDHHATRRRAGGIAQGIWRAAVVYPQRRDDPGCAPVAGGSSASQPC